MITFTETKKTLEKKLYYDYLNYSVSVECTNDGAKGNAFEMCVKLALNNRRFKKVSKNGYFDTRKKSVDGEYINLECKTGSGELWHINRNGKPVNNNFLKSDFVIYCYRFNPLDDLDNQEIFVIPSQIFLDSFEQNNLTRTKQTTSMKKAQIPQELKYNDVYALSTDGISRAKKTDKILMDLISNGQAIYLYEFLQDYFNII